MTIKKHIQLIESFERIDEVRVIGDKEKEPLYDTDTILVYHGTESVEMVAQWITKGVTGDVKSNRSYSYEANNNPKGLFVTPDFETAKKFGSVIVAFHSSVADLESPVWPNGSFTTQGQMSGTFNSDEEREEARLALRKKFSGSGDYISDSDRPELAASLLSNNGERQALFTGDLNPQAVKHVWIKQPPDMANSPFEKIDTKELVKRVKDGEFSSSGHNKTKYEKADKKVVKPREYLSGDEFIDRITDFYNKRKMSGITRDKVKDVLAKNDKTIRMFTWSDRQFKHYQNEIQKINESVISEQIEDVLTVYHGSDHRITDFTLDHLGDGLDEYGPGLYFATDYTTASSHGKYIHEVVIAQDITLVPDTAPDIKLAKRLMEKSPELEMILTDWDEDRNKAFQTALSSMVNSADNMEEMLENVWYDFFRDDSKMFLELVVEMAGYDGKIVTPGIGKYLLLFNTDKIVSVTVTEKDGVEV